MHCLLEREIIISDTTILEHLKIINRYNRNRKRNEIMIKKRTDIISDAPKSLKSEIKK